MARKELLKGEHSKNLEKEEKPMMRPLFKGVCLGVVIFALTIPDGFAQPIPIRVGYTEVFSGPTGILGTLGQRALQTAVEVIKDEGGVINGRNFELTVVDNEASVENAIRQVRRFVGSEGIKFVATGGGTHIANAVQHEAPKLKALLADGDAMSTFLRGKSVAKNMWMSSMPVNIVVKALVKRIVEESHTGLRWVGLNPDYGFGHDVWKEFQKYIKEMDPKAEIGPGVFHPFREANMIPFIEKVIAEKPGGIICASYANDLYNILEQGAPRKLFQNSIFGTFDMMEILKIGGGGDIIPEKTFVADREYWEVNQNHPSRKKYIDKHMQLFGEKPIYFQSCAYNSLYLMAAAIRKAGTADDIEKVIQAAEDLKFDGAHGNEVLRAGDRQVQYPYVPTYILKRATGEPKPDWLKAPKGGWKVEKPVGVTGWYPANMFGSPFAK